MTISGIRINPQELMSKDELLEFLRDNGEDDRAFSKIRDSHYEEYDNELIWRYPISDGAHLGTYIVPVKEGFISLPFDAVDKEDYELLELAGATMLDTAEMQTLIDYWRSFSDDLTGAMADMLRILRGE